MSSSALVDVVEDASRSRSGILTPSSEGSLNRPHGVSSPESRKRKRAADSATMEHLLKPSIAVKPHPQNLHVPPRILHPLMLLPRQHLPLACIDFASANGEFPQSRLYEAHIKILDLESRMGLVPAVLVARNESRGTTYALERQENGHYVICKLGNWVDLDELAGRATAVAHERLHPVKAEQGESLDTNALTTPQLHHEQKKKRAAIEAIQSMMRKRARSQSVYNTEDIAKREPTADPDAGLSELPSSDLKPEPLHHEDHEVHQALPSEPKPGPVLEREPSPQHTADGIFDNVRSHYFDALYKSMGSLAYFAKGPLSRARSMFHLDLEANLDMADLIEFLKSLILTTVQIDKKYRETVPELISKMKDRIESSDEGRKRKRKPKKMKLGKDSLYPQEDESVLTWWNTNKPEPTEEAKISAPQIKSHVSMLRTRETKLQMILIMEILALEPLKAAGETGESNLPPLPGAIDSQDLGTSAQPKKRNKHNLPVLMDVHADRLTIWQSTATDEQLLLEDSQVAHIPLDGSLEKKASAEPLKDFCVDVIVPFFSARLPELCDSINRKLGGPAVIAQVKNQSSKRSSTMRNQKPGSATKRPQPQNARRMLQRALSTEQQNRRSVSRGPSNAIALLRSATSTAIQTVKRESIDLGSVPSNETQKRVAPLSRSSSMSNLQDIKATKKAEVEAELKEAISALRKPNRDVVGRAMAEADERRTSTGITGKKTKKLPRSSFPSNIQVKATPANNRFKNMMPVKFEGGPSILETAEELIPPSSVTAFVPLTGQRSSHRDVYERSPSPETDAVGDTPIKTSAKPSFIRRPANERPVYPPSSPVMGRKATSTNGFVVPGSVTRARPGNEIAGVAETPVKKVAQRIDLCATPDVQPEKKMSIYEKLGWDND